MKTCPDFNLAYRSNATAIRLWPPSGVRNRFMAIASVKLSFTQNWSFLNLSLLCSCQGALRRIRRLNRRDSPLGRSLVSTDLTSDEIPATGGRQRFAPEDDTEFPALKESCEVSFRTFVDVPFFASLKLFSDRLCRSIDLGLSSGISAFAYSLERR